MRVDPAEVEAFQRRIVLSHVVGVGPTLPADIVRAMMVARANMLAAGGSGAGRAVIDHLVALLNHRIHPRVPAKGSLGVTDLSHLAHIAQVLLGGGEAHHGGRWMPGEDALAAAGLSAARLGPKEGLALISSNAGSVGRGALVAFDAARLLSAADLAAALSLEAFSGNVGPFEPEVQQSHPDPGQVETAARLRAFLAGSRLYEPGAARSVQDPYSFRCVPQAHGPARNSVLGARRVIELELNAAGDTPLVAVQTGRIISNGNFLVLGLTLAFEQLAIALAHVTALSVARSKALMSSRMTGLPGTLIASAVPQTGLSILQETATSLQTDIRLRANPSSLDFTPIADGVEDHATGAMDAVAKVEATVQDAAGILAVELLTAAQAADLREPSRLGGGTRRAYENVRRHVPFLREDAPLAPLVDTLAERLSSGEFLAGADAAPAG
jgi:histidine ammonia-lyase